VRCTSRRRRESRNAAPTWAGSCSRGATSPWAS